MAPNGQEGAVFQEGASRHCVRRAPFVLLGVSLSGSRSTNEVSINPRPYRGGGLVQPPLRFFADSEKTAARSATGFWATLWGKPCAIFGKKKLTGSGQVTEL